jgi:3-(3-hydroxy-phenyl)propionate hydroxylase
MLDQLDVTHDLKTLGVTTDCWQVLHLPSGERAVFPLAVLGGLTRHPYRLQCEQYHLARILYERARANPLIALHLGASVRDVTQNSDEASAIADVGGQEKTFSGPFLIGADGAHSVVRQKIGLTLEGATYPSVTMLVTTPFRFEDHVANILGANYVWGTQDSFSMFRLQDVWRCTFYPRPGVEADIDFTAEEANERLQGIVAQPTAYEMHERRTYKIHQRIVAKYRVGRIVLAGDAAHLNAPTGGMGMNGGIHDAFNLSDKLARVMGGESIELLDLYTRQRQPVAKQEIIQQADQNRKRMENRDPAQQMKSLHALQEITRDEGKLLQFVKRASMIEGLEKAAAVT